MKYIQYTYEMLRKLNGNIYHTHAPDNRLVFIEYLENLIEYLNSSEVNDSNSDSYKEIHKSVIKTFMDSFIKDPNRLHELLKDSLSLLELVYQEFDQLEYIRSDLKCFDYLLTYKLSILNYRSALVYLKSVVSTNQNPVFDLMKVIKSKDLSKIDLSHIVFMTPVELSRKSKSYLSNTISSIEPSNKLYELVELWLEIINDYETSTHADLIVEYFKIYLRIIDNLMDNYIHAKDDFYKCLSSKSTYEYKKETRDELKEILDLIVPTNELESLNDLALDIYGSINDSGQNLPTNTRYVEPPNSLGIPELPDSIDPSEFEYSPSYIKNSEYLIILNNDVESSHNTSVMMDNIFTNDEDMKENSRNLLHEVDRLDDSNILMDDNLSNIDSLNSSLESDYVERYSELGLTEAQMGTPSHPKGSSSTDQILREIDDPRINVDNDLKQLAANIDNNSRDSKDIITRINSLNDNFNQLYSKQQKINRQVDFINSKYSNPINSMNSKLYATVLGSAAILNRVNDSLNLSGSKLSKILIGVGVVLAVLSFIKHPDSFIRSIFNLLVAPIEGLLLVLNTLICAIKGIVCLMVGLARGLGDLAESIINGSLAKESYNDLKESFRSLVKSSGGDASLSFMDKLLDKDRRKAEENADAAASSIRDKLGLEKSELFMQAFSEVNSSCDPTSTDHESKNTLSNMISSHFNRVSAELFSSIDHSAKLALGVSGALGCPPIDLIPRGLFKLRAPGSKLNLKLNIPYLNSKVIKC